MALQVEHEGVGPELNWSASDPRGDAVNDDATNASVGPSVADDRAAGLGGDEPATSYYDPLPQPADAPLSSAKSACCTTGLA